MNKTDFIKLIQEKTQLSKKDTEITIDAALDIIVNTLANGEAIKLQGFGNFEVRERSARKGRNPQTGEEINIIETKVPAFKAGKGLKDKVAGK